MPGVVGALDLSLTTGWAVGRAGDSNHQPEGDVWRLPRMRSASGQSQLGLVCSSLANVLEVWLYEYAPDRVVFEAPITRAQNTDRLLKYLCAMVELTCYEAGIPCFEASSYEARKAVLGIRSFHKPVNGAGRMVWVKGKKGAPKTQVLKGDPKEEVAIWCASQGYKPVDDNHADALLLLRYALTFQSKQPEGT